MVEKQSRLNLESTLSEEKLMKVKWQPVPAIDGKNCSTWNDIKTELIENGLQAHMRDDWSKIPILIKNQRVFQMNAEFCQKVSRPTTRLRWLVNVRKGHIIDKTQLYGPITSHDEVLTTKSSAFSFNLDGLVERNMPKSLVLTKLDGIMSFGPWFPGGHIETGGVDSITRVLVGKKSC